MRHRQLAHTATSEFHSGLAKGLTQVFSLLSESTSNLCAQVVDEAQAIGAHCNIRASVWSGEGPHAVQANAFRTAGQLVVSTPGRIAQALENGLIQAAALGKTLSTFVLDEADLLLLHEYESDLQAIAPQVRFLCETQKQLIQGWVRPCL